MAAIVFLYQFSRQLPSCFLYFALGSQFPVGMFEHDRFEGAGHLERNKIVVGDSVSREVCEITPGAGFVWRAVSTVENLDADSPVVTMLQVVGELLAKGDVGGNTTVEEIERISSQQRLQCARQSLGCCQYPRAKGKVDSRSPGEDVFWNEQDSKKQDQGSKTHVMLFHIKSAEQKRKQVNKRLIKMPDKLYQECRALISGCRAIFEDLREAGVETVSLNPPKNNHPTAVGTQKQTESAVAVKVLDSETLNDIQQDLAGCQGCGLCAERTKVVFGVGNPHARLVLVGEAPGFQEDKQGEPFVGEAGRLLDRILFAMKLGREDVYICNVIKCRPPKNRDPEKAEITACEAFLKRQLAAVSPEMILCLGRFASQALLQTGEPIGKLRGRWQTYEGIPLMPTFHPAYLLRNPAGKHQVWEDVKQVMHRLQDGSS